MFYPLDTITRNYYENISLRLVVLVIFEEFCCLKSPGKTDFFKELRVKFVIILKITYFRISFVSNRFVSEGTLARVHQLN